MKIFILKLLVLVSFALSVATMAAGNVDSRTAQAKAIQLLNSQTDMRFNASNANLKLTHAEQSRVNDQMNDFYVFNCDGGGYVIVAGDDRAEEILGYGSGYFDMNNLPDNVAWWMNHYKEQMEYLLAHPKLQVQTLSQQMSGKLTASDVPAMLTCKWDQAAPFYNQCPIYNYNPNIHCLTGAVATAMAQVMYYWKYPAELPALDAYEIENNSSIIVEELPGITLDWDNMRDDYSSSYTTLQADAVAWLMRYCSQAVQTQYSTRFSYADKVNIRDAMIKFGYSTDATIKYRDDYDATDWHAMMQAELEAGRPILYGAMALNNNIYEDHTFVVDGYNASSNKYHVNFGWSGMYNSFFALDAFIVYDNYSAGGYTFNLNQMMFIGVYPDNHEPEAYACYTPENTTLTFYYDTQRSTREGTTYDLNGEFELPGWIMDWLDLENNLHPATQVVFDPSFADARPISTAYWFLGMRNLQSFSGLSYLNTSEVTNMTSMFNNCSGLTSLDLSSFNTARASFIPYMFYRCSNLTTIYAGSGWNLPADGNTEGMFQDCTSLVGSMGTSYDPNHKDGEYAHIDGGPSDPGYLSGHKEAYLCFTADNRTMTFYYDDQINNRLGTIYHLNTAGDLPEWYVQLLDNKCTKAVFDPSFADARPTSTKAWFYRIAVGSITGMEYLNTSEVTDMSYMFTGISLESLDVSHFNTAKVTNMSNMFHGSEFLTSLDLGSFNTSNVTDMNSMFTYCQSLTNLDLSNFNTANVTNMNDMFSNCSGLTSLDLSNFNTANVTDMGYMFNDCRSLTSLDLSNFNTSSVTKMSGMFLECNSLETIYVGDGWSTDAVTQSADMFTDCMSLIGGMGTTYDPNHVDKTYAHIDGGPSDPGYFTDPAVPSEPEAYACFTPSDSTLTFYFDSRRRFRSGTAYDLNTGYVQPDWLQLGTSVSHVVFDASFAEARPTTTFSWFESMSNLVSIAGMNYLNTEDVTIMASMFTECSALTSLDVSHFNTDKVTDMNGMFISCIGLTSLDVSNFNTENVTDMNNMFGNCRGLTSLDLSNFTTETVNNMRYMFYYCNNLTTIYVGNGWSTASVTNSDKMFYRCTKLVGGNGTTYDSSHINADYAHIDGGPSNPGYFTSKLAFEPGDVNGDGKTTIADVTALISSLLSGEPTAGSGDINGDGRVTIADVSLLINQLLGSGS